MRRLKSYEMRLVRVGHLIHELDSEILRYLGTHPYSVTVHDSPDNTENIVTLDIAKPIPRQLGVIVSDAIHNLRASLDNLYFALAQSHAKGVMSEGFAGGLYFPTKWKASDEDLAKYISEVGPHAGAIIERLQPYNCGDGYLDSPLWHLKRLSNVDKHRLPHLLLFRMKSTKVSGSTMREGFISDFITFSGPLLDNNAEVCRYPRDFPDGPEVNVNVAFDFTVGLSPPEGVPVWRGGVVDYLKFMRHYVAYSIFAPLRQYASPY